MYFSKLIDCIEDEKETKELKLLDKGSEGIILKDGQEAIKIYKKFYESFVYNDKTISSEELKEHLMLKMRINEYTNKNATSKMVVAQSLLYLPDYSTSVPIGNIMDYKELDSKHPNFRKLRVKGSIENIIDLSILASDEIKQMHNNDNIHSDLHGKNIGITKEKDICIFDCDGCYIEKYNNDQQSSTAVFYESFMKDSYTKKYDKYCLSLMILQVLSNYYIRLTNQETINHAISNLKINNENIKNYFKTLLNPTIEQGYVGDVLKKVKKYT